jgi:hypothetical protein
LRRVVSAAPYPRLVPNACRFCGSTAHKIDNEHVWPDWLADFLPEIRGTGYSERWSSAAGRERWPEAPLKATVRTFCKDCNSGWMSQVENAAKSIVGPMVIGKHTQIDEESQRIVANWIAVKCLVAVQTSKAPQPPDSHYRRVRHFRGVPPNTMRVWIGWQRNLAEMDRPGKVQLFDSHFLPVTNAFQQSPLPADVERYRREGGVFNGSIFRVGHFVGIALQHDWPGLQARPSPRSAAAEALLPIWPTGPTVQWPPFRPVDDLGDLHSVTQFLEIAPPLVRIYEP